MRGAARLVRVLLLASVAATSSLRDADDRHAAHRVDHDGLQSSTGDAIAHETRTRIMRRQRAGASHAHLEPPRFRNTHKVNAGIQALDGAPSPTAMPTNVPPPVVFEIMKFAHKCDEGDKRWRIESAEECRWAANLAIGVGKYGMVEKTGDKRVPGGCSVLRSVLRAFEEGSARRARVVWNDDDNTLGNPFGPARPGNCVLDKQPVESKTIAMYNNKTDATDAEDAAGVREKEEKKCLRTCRLYAVDPTHAAHPPSGCELDDMGNCKVYIKPVNGAQVKEKAFEADGSNQKKDDPSVCWLPEVTFGDPRFGACTYMREKVDSSKNLGSVTGADAFERQTKCLQKCIKYGATMPGAAKITACEFKTEPNAVSCLAYTAPVDGVARHKTSSVCWRAASARQKLDDFDIRMPLCRNRASAGLPPTSQPTTLASMRESKRKEAESKTTVHNRHCGSVCCGPLHTPAVRMSDDGMWGEVDCVPAGEDTGFGVHAYDTALGAQDRMSLFGSGIFTYRFYCVGHPKGPATGLSSGGYGCITEGCSRMPVDKRNPPIPGSPTEMQCHACGIRATSPEEKDFVQSQPKPTPRPETPKTLEEKHVCVRSRIAAGPVDMLNERGQYLECGPLGCGTKRGAAEFAARCSLACAAHRRKKPHSRGCCNALLQTGKPPACQWLETFASTPLSEKVTNKVQNLQQCGLAYCNAHEDLKHAYCESTTCTSQQQAQECLRHWDKFGRQEKRTPDPYACSTSVAPTNKGQNLQQCGLAYCNAHGDLKHAYCGSTTCTSQQQAQECLRHWDKFGRQEKRTPDPYECLVRPPDTGYFFAAEFLPPPTSTTLDAPALSEDGTEMQPIFYYFGKCLTACPELTSPFGRVCDCTVAGKNPLQHWFQATETCEDVQGLRSQGEDINVCCPSTCNTCGRNADCDKAGGCCAENIVMEQKLCTQANGPPCISAPLDKNWPKRGVSGTGSKIIHGGACEHWCRTHKEEDGTPSPWSLRCSWETRACSGCPECAPLASAGMEPAGYEFEMPDALKADLAAIANADGDPAKKPRCLAKCPKGDYAKDGVCIQCSRCHATTQFIKDGCGAGDSGMFRDATCGTCRTSCREGTYEAGKCDGYTDMMCVRCGACPTGEMRVDCQGRSTGKCVPRPTPAPTAPTPAPTPAPACVDTPGWRTSDQTGRMTCKDYEEKGYCAGGVFEDRYKWTGAEMYRATPADSSNCGGGICAAYFNHPGKHCCACGKAPDPFLMANWEARRDPEGPCPFGTVTGAADESSPSPTLGECCPGEADLPGGSCRNDHGKFPRQYTCMLRGGAAATCDPAQPDGGKLEVAGEALPLPEELMCADVKPEADGYTAPSTKVPLPAAPVDGAGPAPVCTPALVGAVLQDRSLLAALGKDGVMQDVVQGCIKPGPLIKDSSALDSAVIVAGKWNILRKQAPGLHHGSMTIQQVDLYGGDTSRTAPLGSFARMFFSNTEGLADYTVAVDILDVDGVLGKGRVGILIRAEIPGISTSSAAATTLFLEADEHDAVPGSTLVYPRTGKGPGNERSFTQDRYYGCMLVQDRAMENYGGRKAILVEAPDVLINKAEEKAVRGAHLGGPKIARGGGAGGNDAGGGRRLLSDQRFRGGMAKEKEKMCTNWGDRKQPSGKPYYGSCLSEDSECGQCFEDGACKCDTHTHCCEANKLRLQLDAVGRRLTCRVEGKIVDSAVVPVPTKEQCEQAARAAGKTFDNDEAANGRHWRKGCIISNTGRVYYNTDTVGGEEGAYFGPTDAVLTGAVGFATYKARATFANATILPVDKCVCAKCGESVSGHGALKTGVCNLASRVCNAQKTDITGKEQCYAMLASGATSDDHDAATYAGACDCELETYTPSKTSVRPRAPRALAYQCNLGMHDVLVAMRAGLEIRSPNGLYAFRVERELKDGVKLVALPRPPPAVGASDDIPAKPHTAEAKLWRWQPGAKKNRECRGPDKLRELPASATRTLRDCSLECALYEPKTDAGETPGSKCDYFAYFPEEHRNQGGCLLCAGDLSSSKESTWPTVLFTKTMLSPEELAAPGEKSIFSIKATTKAIEAIGEGKPVYVRLGVSGEPELADKKASSALGSALHGLLLGLTGKTVRGATAPAAMFVAVLDVGTMALYAGTPAKPRGLVWCSGATKVGKSIGRCALPGAPSGNVHGSYSTVGRGECSGDDAGATWDGASGLCEGTECIPTMCQDRCDCDAGCLGFSVDSAASIPTCTFYCDAKGPLCNAGRSRARKPPKRSDGRKATTKCYAKKENFLGSRTTGGRCGYASAT